MTLLTNKSAVNKAVIDYESTVPFIVDVLESMQHCVVGGNDHPMNTVCWHSDIK